MDGLEPDLTKILNLRLINGCSAAETAYILGKTEADVYAGQYRALYALARWLDHNQA